MLDMVAACVTSEQRLSVWHGVFVRLSLLDSTDASNWGELDFAPRLGWQM